MGKLRLIKMDGEENENFEEEEGAEAPWDDLMSEDVPSMDPNDPLLRPVQEAIHKVLTGNHDKLSLGLRGQVEELKRVKVQREEGGVELYQVQQQLAKLQMSLERSHEQYNIMSQMRTGSEEDNQQISDAYGNRKTELQEQRNKLGKYEGELDKVNLTLRQVETYNEQMRAEIAVTRRATYKAEADIQQLEEKQNWQDLYIDSQHDKIKRLEEQLALYDAQLESQKQETKAAADTLHEASEEMQAINYEKRTLLQQWKSSLIALQRRDEALQQTTFERYASGEQKDAKKVHEEVSEKEVQVSQLQNELSRIRVDSLNTLAHNNALKDTRNTILKDLEEKESLIDQIEVEIARK